MQYRDILVISGRVAQIILNQPEKRNALSSSTLSELIDAIWKLDHNPNVAVIVLSGAGKGFCAGADLSELTLEGTIAEDLQKKRHIMDLLIAMSQASKVIISQVHGFALAGGFGIAMSADLTVLADDCKLGMPEICRGLAPMNIMNPLSRCMPRKILLELMLTGRLISATEALQLGLANKVVSADMLKPATFALAEEIASNSISALSMCKSAFYHMQDMDYYSAFHYLTDRLELISMTKDAKEGAVAFLEKRKPKWRDC